MLEELPAISPIHFFTLSCDCLAYKQELKGEHLLPDLSAASGEIAFAKVYMGWNEEGIKLEVAQSARKFITSFPDFERGDAYEFFFDTRDIKTTGYNTRFCHHFYFLPEEASEIENGAGEITRFRGEEAHELCEGSKLLIKTRSSKGQSISEIFIPKEALHGFDPLQFQRLGFTYRLNHSDGSKQHFSCNSQDLTIEDQPSLWASFQLR